MFRYRSPVRFVAAVVVLFALTVSAIGQETAQSTPATASAPDPPSSAAAANSTATPAPAPTHQMIKVMKSLTRYDEGTKLDIRLNDGSHQIGKVSETLSTYFVFVDSASGKDRIINYIDVDSVRATSKEQAARELHKIRNSVPGLVIVAVAAIVALCVVGVLAAHK